MPEQIDASAPDAIEAVAEEGLKRNRTGKRNFLLVVLLVVFFTSAVGVVVLVTDISGKLKVANDRLKELDPKVELKPLHPVSPVAVLLPHRESSSVVENANRQWKGFELAFSNHQVDEKEEHIYEFDYPFKGDNGKDTREKIIEKLKGWYGEGRRTFVITMSGAVLEIKKEFKKWVKSLPENDKPVLVATVASAPEIVDFEHGIFRHYIRSEDESGVLATYIESINAQDVGVFWVKDDYGRSAKDSLKSRFSTSKNTVVSSYSIRLRPEEMKKDIPIQVEKFISDISGDNKAVAVIIGYGSMIKDTLVELEDKFAGEILVVSTFTEEAWRPDFNQIGGSLASRIRFVGPGTVDDDKDMRGVVFQFSYLTLNRALACKDERGVEAFWVCWKGSPTNLKKRGIEWAQVEFTADGDSHVSLRLLKVDE